MTTIELRKSIVEDMNLMSEEMLGKMSEYGKKLLSHSAKHVKTRTATQKKIVIDYDIQKLMGRFPIPADFNEESFIAQMRLKDYLMQERTIS